MNSKNNTMSVIFLFFSVLIDVGFMILLIKYMGSFDVSSEKYATAFIFNIIPLLLFNILLVGGPYISKNSESSMTIASVTASVIYLVIQTVITILFYKTLSIVFFIAISLFIAAFAIVAIMIMFSNMKKAASWGNTDSERLYKKMSDTDMDKINQNYFKD